MTKIEKILDKIKPPKGSDWLFYCGYMLAVRHIKEKLKRKKNVKNKLIK